MKRGLIIVLLFSVNLLFGQGSAPEIQTAVLIQGFNNGAVNGAGSSALVNKPANIYSLNPASLINFNKPSFGVSYQTESKIDEAYIAGIGYSRMHSSVPESFGIIYPFGNLKIGLGFGQTYNGKLLFGEIPITTVDQPDGTGRTISPIFETKINTYTAALSQSFDNILQQGDRGSIGFRINRNILHYFSKLDVASLDADAGSFNFALGASYYKNIEAGRNLGMALFFESSMVFSKYVQYQNYGYTTVGPQSPVQRGGITYNTEIAGGHLSGRVPSRLVFDLDYDLYSNLKLLGSLSTFFWNASNNGYNDQFNLSGGVIYSVTEMLDLSAGFYTFSRGTASAEIENHFNLSNGEDAYYLTAGITMKFFGFNADVSIADSWLLSDHWRKQTIFKFGLGYGF